MIAIPRSVGKGLTAQVIRGNEARAQRLTPFHRAIEVYAAKPQWAGGEEVTISEGQLQGRPGRIYLRNEGGRIILSLYRQGSSLMSNLISPPFPVAILTGNGWATAADATEANYLAWQRQVQALIEKQK
jgi:hypothetical protein